MTQTVDNEAKTKSELIREQLAAGNTQVANIRDTLRAQGVTVSDNLIHTIKKKEERARAQEIAPGVVRVSSRPEGQEATALARHGSKKEMIIQLYNQGTTKASEIKAEMDRRGLETSVNNIYVVLAGLRAGSKKAPAKAKPAAPAPKGPVKVAPKAKPEETLHPELVALMQAAALQYGVRAVEQAAGHVAGRSREMIRDIFRVA